MNSEPRFESGTLDYQRSDRVSRADLSPDGDPSKDIKNQQPQDQDRYKQNPDAKIWNKGQRSENDSQADAYGNENKNE